MKLKVVLVLEAPSVVRAMASASGQRRKEVGPSFSAGLAGATPRNLLTSTHQRQHAQL